MEYSLTFNNTVKYENEIDHQDAIIIGVRNFADNIIVNHALELFDKEYQPVSDLVNFRFYYQENFDHILIDNYDVKKVENIILVNYKGAVLLHNEQKKDQKITRYSFEFLAVIQLQNKD